MKPLSILIVEDHPLISESYERILKVTFFNEPHMVFTNSLNEARQAIEKESFDIAIVDILLGKIGSDQFELGDQFAQEIRTYHPNTKLVLATYINDDGRIYNLYDIFKPEGFLIKNSFTSHDFSQAMRIIAQGEPYYSPSVQKLVHSRDYFCAKFNGLNQKHFRFLLYLKAGYTNLQLSHVLRCSERTINDLKKEVRDSFGISVQDNIIEEAERRGVL